MPQELARSEDERASEASGGSPSSHVSRRAAASPSPAKTWWQKALTWGPAIAAVLAAGASVATIVSVLKTEPEPSPLRQKLMWAPADCGSAAPMVAVGSCSNLASLDWLRGKMHLLRTGKISGFAELPEDFLLRPEEYHGKPNWLLYVTVGGQRQGLVGVGYDAETQSKDGALRLYPMRGGKSSSPAAQLDVNGDWWLRQPSGDWVALK